VEAEKRLTRFEEKLDSAGDNPTAPKELSLARVPLIFWALWAHNF